MTFGRLRSTQNYGGFCQLTNSTLLFENMFGSHPSSSLLKNYSSNGSHQYKDERTNRRTDRFYISLSKIPLENTSFKALHTLHKLNMEGIQTDVHKKRLIEIVDFKRPASRAVGKFEMTIFYSKNDLSQISLDTQIRTVHKYPWTTVC